MSSTSEKGSKTTQTTASTQQNRNNNHEQSAKNAGQIKNAGTANLQDSTNKFGGPTATNFGSQPSHGNQQSNKNKTHK